MVDVNTAQGTLTILIAGVLATYIWRLSGAVVASRIDENALWLAWIKAVATALIAGLVARLIFFPPGTLALSPLWLRLAGAGAAAGFYYLVSPRLWLALIVGEIVFALGWYFAVVA
jgi:branched-subunit amino acid transport protein